MSREIFPPPETTTAQGKKLVTTVSLTNTGTYPSKTVGFTLEAQTDRHTYWNSKIMELVLPPKACIKITIEIFYESLDEVILTNGISVYDVFSE